MKLLAFLIKTNSVTGLYKMNWNVFLTTVITSEKSKLPAQLHGWTFFIYRRYKMDFRSSSEEKKGGGGIMKRP